MNVDQRIEKILGILRKRHWTIGIMESCTGGALSNTVTNVPGASDVFMGSLVTYSNEAKIKVGVDEKIIKKFGVYSKQVAEEMARKIGGELGVGITGNLPGEIFVVVRIEDQVKSIKFKAESKNKNKIEARKEMKEMVVEKVIDMIIDGL